MRGLWLVVAGFWCTGCLGQSCHMMGCGGRGTQVQLVDDQGTLVATVRGEYRGSGTHRELPERAFDCQEDEEAGWGVWCEAGVLHTLPPSGADSVDEVRFRLANGEFTEWQQVALHITSHTDPDFNGPGCPCSWHEATAERLVVPAEAREPTPDPDATPQCFATSELPESWFDEAAGGASSLTCPIASETDLSVGVCVFELFETMPIVREGDERPCCYPARVIHCR